MKKTVLLILLVLVACALGFWAGQTLPRGARVFAALGNLGAKQNADFEQLESVQQFTNLNGLLGDMQAMVLADARSEREAIEGMRWLLRTLAMSAEVAADADPRHPYFARMDTPARKVGGDNPDAEYDHAIIDGRYDYRITGNLGSVRYLSFTLTAGQGMTPRRMAAFINDRNLTTDANGNFTLWLTKQKPSEPGDWIEIPEDASGVLARQYIADRAREELAQYRIDVVGQVPRDPDNDEQIANALVGASYAFLKLSRLHKTVLPELWDTPNQFVRATSKRLGGAISGSDNLYMLAAFDVAEDEALIIDVIPPDTRYWNLALETRWHESPDYRWRNTSHTLDQVNRREDGLVRFVVAHQDPGLPNWIDTAGHRFGFLTFRWLETEDVAIPKIEKVSLQTLRQAVAQ